MPPAKQATAKKAPATKAAVKKVAVKKVATSAAATKAPVKKAPVKKAPVKKAPVKKAGAAKDAGTKAATKSSSVRSVPATAAPTKKASLTKAVPVKQTSAKAPAAKKPAAPKKPPFDAKFIEAQRLLLLEERATYTKQADSLQAEADSLAELREPGDVQFDEESGEGDTLQVERERDLALSARARYEVEEIDRALLKIEDGSYGICEISGQPIPKARLQAIPQCRERVEYKVGGFGRR